VIRHLVNYLRAANCAGLAAIAAVSASASPLLSTSSAAPMAFSLRVWQTDEGLPDNRVQAAAQMSDGYLWVATRAGIARFDGVQFTIFNTTNTAAFKSDYVTTLAAVPDDTLWIGTGDGVLQWRAGKFRDVPEMVALSNATVRSIFRSPDGSIWIGSSAGLSHFQNERLITYNSSQGLLSDHVNSVLEDRDGRVWIGTANGLNWFDQSKTGEAANINGLTNDAVLSLREDKQGRLWIGTAHGLVLRCKAGQTAPPEFDRCINGENFSHYYTYDTRSGLMDNFVNCIYEDSRSNLWIGTYSGLNRFIDGIFHPEVNSGGMPYDHINSMFEDRWGDVWVCSREGLIRLTPRPFTVYTKKDGLSHNNVTSLMIDGSGILWAGTRGGGLNEIIKGGVRVHSKATGFPNDLILALCGDRDGGMWVGSDNGGGLVYLNRKKTLHFTENDGLPDTAVSTMLQDRDGTLWIGTPVGLFRRAGERFTWESAVGHSPVRSLCEDREGALWIGGESGLMRLRGGVYERMTISEVKPFPAISALCQDADGKTIWAGTTKAGLLRWRDGRFTRYSTKGGLFSDEILGILENDGWLWMTSTKGIFRVSEKDLELPLTIIRCINYGRGDGLESIDCAGSATPTIWKTSDDWLCFATTKGLAVIDAAHARNELSPPLVRLEQVNVDRKSVPLCDSGRLTVPPNRGELEFLYTALDLRAPEKCRFKYKLEGVDSDWIEAGTHRSAHYNNVGPGEYWFHVIACNKDGVWDTSGASLFVISLPHFWQRAWFRAAVLLGIISLAAGIARFVTREKMRQKLALLQMQHSLEKERTRISRDIHDDLGTTLTQITFLSELAQREADEPVMVKQFTAQISQTVRELVQSMDEIVWAVNPRNDKLPMLTAYIFQHAEKLFAGTSIRCRFDSPDEWPDQLLSAETRHHVFLAAKEALNNAARHSGATEVWVRGELKAGEMELSVEDNGRGIARDTNGQRGNGLPNTRKRMEEIGGVFELTSVEGVGTTVRLRIKLKK
jgi:ligand-binding sensor domain-containing protein/signal transduction histidine kinase